MFITVAQTLNDYLDEIGLVGTFGQVFFAVMIILFILIALALIGAPFLILLITAVSMILVAFAFGFIPGWIILLLIISFMLFSIMNFRGSGQSV